MEITERLTGLATLLHICENAVGGKKRLQKLVYLAQHLGFPLDYDYYYYNFGVFSAELESDLRIAEQIGILAQEPTGNGIEVSVKLLKEVRSVDVPKEAEGALKNLCREEPRSLEVLSTILFLQDEGYTGDGLTKELQRLKGHLPPANHEKAKKLYGSYFGNRECRGQSLPRC